MFKVMHSDGTFTQNFGIIEVNGLNWEVDDSMFKIKK